MNAVTELPEAQLDLIPIGSIRPSGTAVQALRRQHYSAEKLLELAASIQQNGVLQPILVRPVAPDGTVKYEIVAGERRYIAADRAGLAHIPCVVRDLDDIQTLQAQLVENIEREQLSALEEAVGFDEMRKNSAAISAEDIGARIGKSRSYVYARLKLLDLIPAAREALASGEIDASKALILARIKGEKMQTRALKLLREQGSYYSYRRLMERLRDDLMIRLERAPWLPDRDTLHVPKTGAPVPACATCPHNSSNDPELAEAIEGTDLCTDRGCFELKLKLHNARILKEYEDAGHTVISGDAVKEVLDEPRGYMGGSIVHNGYVRLNAEVDTIEFTEPEPKPKKGQTEDDLENDPDWQAWAQREAAFEPPTYSQLLGTVVGTQLVQTAKGDIIPVAPVAAVTKALKAKGVDIPWPLKQKQSRDDEPQADPAKEAADRARAEERFQVEVEYRKRLLRAIHDKFKGPLKQGDLAMIAEIILDEGGKYVLFDNLFDGKRPDLGKFKEVDLSRLIIAFCLDDEADNVHTKPGRMLAYCQRLKIDPKKIRAEVVKDLKPTAAAASEETKPTKAKKGAKK